MVSRLKSYVKRIAPEELHLSILPRPVKQAFLYLTSHRLLSPDWYLAGGTALALQVGHRRSRDLDFFIPQNNFDEAALDRRLFKTGLWQVSLRERGTVYGTFMGGKASFIAYPFFHPSAHRLSCGSVRILLPEDIASMKIIAISQRGRKRDFVDLYWYCINREKLKEVVLRAIRQYPGQEHNLPHFLKSLMYFEDAEADLMPRISFRASWREIKKYFEREAAHLAKELLA